MTDWMTKEYSPYGPELPDSGARQEFATGAVRDRSDMKPRPALVTPFGMERVAMHYARGAKKYADRNWEKGMPLSDTLESLERHVYRLKMYYHHQAEDHLAAIAWNALAMMHYEAMVRAGTLPPELIDLPDYGIEEKI